MTSQPDESGSTQLNKIIAAYLEAITTVLDAANDNAPLRSGISLCIGSLTEVSAETKQIWKPVLAHWHTQQAASATNSVP